MTVSPSSYTTNKDTALRLGAKGRRVFTAAGWNQALRDAGKFAGDWWIGNYGVLRFNSAYARSVLGYKPGSRKSKRMARGEPPFFSTGRFMAGFNTRARTEATAAKGVSRFFVIVPGGWLNAHPEHVATFRKVPPREKAAVAREFRRALIQALQAGRVAHAQKLRAREAAAAHKAAVRAEISAGRKARNARARLDARAAARADRASVRSANRQLRRQRAFGKARIKLQ